MKNPTNECVSPSCGTEGVWLQASIWGEVFGGRGMCIHMGILLASALGSTFMGRGLQPCLVTNFRVVWNAQWPSVLCQCRADLHLSGRGSG